MKSYTKASSSKGSKILNIISNVLFVIVMILLIIFMVYGFGSLSKNKVPSFFGQSYVRIMSGSMENSGFNKGDVVMIERKNISEIEVGDIIAFYQDGLKEPDSYVEGDELESIKIKDFATGQKSFNCKIVFHQIIDLKVDSEGYIWYQTWGTSNVNIHGDPVPDFRLTRSDRVVGVYKDSPMAGILQFMSSSTGIIVLVVAPSCVVLLLLLFNIIDIIDKMIKEKRAEQERTKAIILEGNRGNEKDDGKEE